MTTALEGIERTEEFLWMEARTIAAEVGSAILLGSTAVVASYLYAAMYLLGWLFPSGEGSQTEVVLVLQGYGAPGMSYLGVCAMIEWAAWFSGRDVKAIVPRIGTRFGNLNCKSFDFITGAVDDAIAKHKPKLIVGQSLGGIIAAAATARHDKLHACAIGSPINGGTPLLPLQRLATRQLGVDPANLPEHVQAMLDAIHRDPGRIVTVAGRWDRIAPPDRCYLHGATNIMVEGGLADTHCGMMLSWEVWKHIGRAYRRASLSLRPVPNLALVRAG